MPNLQWSYLGSSRACIKYFQVALSATTCFLLCYTGFGEYYCTSNWVFSYTSGLNFAFSVANFVVFLLYFVDVVSYCAERVYVGAATILFIANFCTLFYLLVVESYKGIRFGAIVFLVIFQCLFYMLELKLLERAVWEKKRLAATQTIF
ncbi:hypothetical protein M3Y97_00677800 [Aphelenchoides bicaudatus]|nr:hypothetical protein M3Y97_00677800 [Aphelenchoides bicaudatus]